MVDHTYSVAPFKVSTTETVLSKTAPSVSDAHKIVLPHVGENKIYEQQINVFGAKEITLHFEFDGLYMEEHVSATDVRDDSYATSCEGLPFPVDAKKVVQTKEFTRDKEGNVSIQWCILAVPCGKTEREAFLAGTKTFSGYTRNSISRNITIPFTFLESDWERFRDIPKILKDPDTEIYVRICRTDNFNSSGKVSYIGYSAPGDGSVWNHTTTILPVAPPSLKVAGITPAPTDNIEDDNIDPTFSPAGGSFGSVTCPAKPVDPTDPTDPTDPDNPCNCSGINLGSGYQVFKQKNGSVFEFRTLQSGENITLSQENDVITISSTAAESKVELDPITSGPSLFISGVSAKIYKVNETLTIPVFVGGTSLINKNVTVEITRTTGNGDIQIPVTVPGVTALWTSPKLTVSGPVDDVNQVLSSINYVVPADEQGEVIFSATITDSKNQKQRSCLDATLLNPATKSEGKEAYVRGSLSGNSGQIRLKVNGLYIHDAWIPYNVSLSNTSHNLVDNINSSTTTPNFTASYDGTTNQIIVNAAKALGSDANGFILTFDTTGTLAWSGGANMNGGVDKDASLIDNIGSFLTDKNLWANIAGGTAGGLLTWWMVPDASTTSISFSASTTGDYTRSVAFLYRGKVVRVPANFDVNTNTYGGEWDYATFKEVYCNDPAWCLLDYLTNENYGSGKLLSLSSTDLNTLYKDLYKCSLRNNEMVDNGSGSLEARYTINTVIQANLSKWDAIQGIASSMHAKVVWHRGQIRVSQDRPDIISHVFNNCNVVNGSFNWSSGSASTSYSVVDVIWNNPTMYYRQDILAVQDDDLVEKYGTRSIEEIAFGCTRRGQAARHGLWVIQTDKVEPQQIDFSAGWDAYDVMPGNIIAIEDQYKSRNPLNNRFTTNTSTRMKLAEPITMKFPDNYKLRYRLADGTVVLRSVVGIRDENMYSLPMTDTQTNIKYIDVNTTIGIIGEWPVVNIVGNGAGKDEKLFRVIKVSEDNFGTFGITAVRYYPDKYTYIDDPENYIQ